MFAVIILVCMLSGGFQRILAGGHRFTLRILFGELQFSLNTLHLRDGEDAVHGLTDAFILYLYFLYILHLVGYVCLIIK